MGQMFDQSRDQMHNWRLGNPRTLRDYVDRSNRQTTSWGKVKHTGERFSSYGWDDLRAMIEPPSCRQYKPGDCLASRPLNWDEIFDKHDDDENWVDPGAPSGGRSRPRDGNDIDNGEGEEDMQGGVKGTGKDNRTKHWEGTGKGKRKGKVTAMDKGKRMGNSKGKGIVKPTPGGDDISCAVALRLEKELCEADFNMEG